MLLLCSCFIHSVEAVWSPLPGITISNPSTFSEEQQIGIDASGNATAIWREYDGVHTNIRTANLAKGSSWIANPLPLSSIGGNNTQANPQIAITPSGYAVAIWEEFDGTNSIVRAATRASFSSPWSAPVTLSLPTTSPAQIPQIAVDPAGNAVAIWVSFNGTINQIQGATLAFGGSWSTPVTISSPGVDAFFPNVSVDAAGNAVAVWTWQAFPNFITQSASLPFNGSWTAPVNLSNPAESATQADLEISPLGYAVAVWQSNNGSDVVIEAATLQFGGAWSAFQVLSTAGSNAFEADVVVDRVGNAYAVWTQNIGSDFIIQSANLPFGSSIWSTPVGISPIGAFSVDPDIGVDSAGNAIAVWDRSNGTDTVIQAAMLPFGGSWSSPIDLSTAGQTSVLAQIAIDPTGYAVVDWTNQTLNVIQATTWIPCPTVINVAPNFGPPEGDNKVTITGTNFINVTAVKFGTKDALSFVVNSSTSITAIAPHGKEGTIVNVTVATPSCTSQITATDRYSYRHKHTHDE